MRKILLTGGAGFIGSHIFEHLTNVFPDADITVLDRMTYAADFENISHLLERGKKELCVGNVTDLALCTRLTEDVDCIVHAAAESHVDNSFGNSIEFTLSNTLGTHTLLEAARINRTPLFIHVSTDEVYGEVLKGNSREDDRLDPSNPYSASKASAEMIVRSYHYSYSLPVVTIRANNIFGIRQYPEKIIPKFTMQLLHGQAMTVHGNGGNSRKYLAVEDFARAITLLMEKGVLGEVYNVGTEKSYTNLEIAQKLCAILNMDVGQALQFVEDRPFNDQRYSVDTSKIEALGWHPTISLDDALPTVVDWYRENIFRYSHIFAR